MEKVELIQRKLFKVLNIEASSLSTILLWSSELRQQSNYKIIKVLSELGAEQLNLLESIYCKKEDLDKKSNHPDRFKDALIELENESSSSSDESLSSWSSYSSTSESSITSSSMVTSCDSSSWSFLEAEKSVWEENKEKLDQIFKQSMAFSVAQSEINKKLLDEVKRLEEISKASNARTEKLISAMESKFKAGESKTGYMASYQYAINATNYATIEIDPSTTPKIQYVLYKYINGTLVQSFDLTFITTP